MALLEFRNEPFLNFHDDGTKRAMREALTAVESRLGVELPLVIGGERMYAAEKFESRNPSQSDEVVAVAQKGSAQHVERAIEAAWGAFQVWKRVPPEEKAALFLRAGDLLRRRKLEAQAWMIFEVGKNWGEADGDVGESIDHLEYFAREILRYAEGRPTTWHPQEVSYYSYDPIGVVAVIPPWNFPLAIPMGMALGAIAAGNTVVMKPSSDSPATVYPFVEVMEQAGLPPGVLNVVTGSGSVVGDGLVNHPRVRMVAFTGSREVGCRIYEQAAKVQPGQIWLKRVIAEMGGKNAVVVDEEADVEEAVVAAVASGYGFQGQKCSAGSRLVITEKVYGDVVEAFTERVRALEIGPGKENYPVGPVINEGAMRGILDYIQIGKGEGRLLAGGEPGDGAGYYIQPTVFADVSRDARIAQEEIFGPVVVVIKARDFSDALDIANGTEYGLTGAVFTRNPDKIARARAEFACGNLYINRKCTGALVGVHPFGGFNMSGTDAKVGGPDYLLYFLQPKVTTIKHR